MVFQENTVLRNSKDPHMPLFRVEQKWRKELSKVLLNDDSQIYSYPYTGEWLSSLSPLQINHSMQETLSASEGSTLAFFPQLIDILLLTTAIVSTLVSLLIPCLYYLKRQCRQHPTVLIANISLLQSIANFNIVLMAVDIFAWEGVVRIREVFAVLTLGLIQIEPASEDNDFCIYNYCVYMLVELLSISFHICYAVDLLLTIKLPFLTGKKRRKVYYIFSLVLLLLTLANSFEEASDICQNELAVESIYKVPLWFLVTLVLFCVVSFVIILMSFFQGGKQAKIRQEYIRHHRAILFLLVIMWVPPIYTNFLIRFGQVNSTYFDIANKISFFCIIALTGVISIVRMAFDRFLREKVRQMVCQFGARHVRESVSEQDYVELPPAPPVNEQVWNLPLSEAMNEFQSQEIVHCIIQVVCEACAARHVPKASNLGSTDPQERNSTILYESVYRNTVVVEANEQEESKGPLSGLFGREKRQKYQRMNPHEASLEDLKQLCKKKRKFDMVCLADKIQEAQGGERLAQKTVHIVSNILKSNSIPQQEVRDMLRIKVTSYSHRVFETLRQYDNLFTDTLIDTLSLPKNIDSIRKAKQSLGASGSFFFFSSDHRIVIKTISEEEKDRFIDILPFYFDHVRYNQGSLLARTYGIFSIEIAGTSKIYFQMMENAFRRMEQKGIKYHVYDLKGSTVQREVKDRNAAVLKDINYFKSSDCFLFLTPKTKMKLIDDITKDIDMLRKHNIMDYSLLLGVGRSKNEGSKKELFSRGVAASGEGDWRYVTELEEVTRRVYSIALIDYLQQFNFSKKMELWLKRIFKGGGDISSVGTEIYYQRFLNFLNRTVLTLNIKLQRQKPLFRVSDTL